MKDVTKFKILFYVVLILCSCKSVKTKNDDLAKTIIESDILIRNNRLTEAQEKLSLLHKIYPNNIEVAKKLGLVKYHTNDKWGAYQMLQKADSLSKGQNPEITYSTALAAFETSKFNEASEYFNNFIKNSTDQSKIAKALGYNAKIEHIKKFMQDSSKVEITLLSSNINTPNDEFLAFPTLDNETLLFSRRYKNGMSVSEVLMKSLKEDKGWSMATGFEDFDLATGTLSGDGNTLVSTTCERYQSIGSCDLMIAYKQNGKWSLPKNMSDLINSLDWDAQPSISSDGKTIFFSTSRKGGMGNRDLYYTTKNSNGWQIPINLSENINTVANEESPFLHADGKTLYFRSDAENGLGSYDIYFSRFDEVNNIWSKPINLGYPINTIGDDGAFTLAPDGITAYITSNRHTLNNPRPNFDIFTFKLPTRFSAIPTTYASIVVTDKNDKKVLLPRITIIESLSSKTMYEGFVNAEGKYTTPLLTGKEYAILVDLPDYYPLSISYTPSVVSEIISPLIVELEMEKIYSEKPIVLNNILFEVGSARLIKNVNLDLQYLLNLLKNNPAMSLKIVGHTDNTGNPESNQKLSLDRAKAVAQYLIDSGILASRMTTEGKGESAPVTSNDSDVGRRRNRRTEIFARK